MRAPWARSCITGPWSLQDSGNNPDNATDNHTGFLFCDRPLSCATFLYEKRLKTHASFTTQRLQTFGCCRTRAMCRSKAHHSHALCCLDRWKAPCPLYYKGCVLHGSGIPYTGQHPRLYLRETARWPCRRQQATTMLRGCAVSGFFCRGRRRACVVHGLAVNCKVVGRAPCPAATHQEALRRVLHRRRRTPAPSVGSNRVWSWQGTPLEDRSHAPRREALQMQSSLRWRETCARRESAWMGWRPPTSRCTAPWTRGSCWRLSVRGSWTSCSATPATMWRTAGAS